MTPELCNSRRNKIQNHGILMLKKTYGKFNF